MTNDAASRLVGLYPRGWRKRYGDEFAHVLREQRLTLKLALDVIGGAIDARLQGGDMTTMMKRCAAGGPQLTSDDAWRSAGAMIGSSLTFAGLYILAKMHLENKELVDAFGIMAYPAALMVSMPYMYMKHHSRTAKVATIAVCLTILAAFSYLSTLI